MEHSPPEPGELTAFQRANRWGRANAERAETWFDGLRQRVSIIDVGVKVAERDKEAAGTLLGSALALRLFLFFMPFVLTIAGLAGLIGSASDAKSTADTAGVAGTLGSYVRDAFSQTGTAPWIALGAGLLGIATAGRSLTRALVLSSALSWRLGGKQRTPVRVTGVVVGLIVGLSLSATIVNRINMATGAAVASVSVVASAAVYAVLWLLLFQTLPRSTSDPGAALPGALLIAVVLAGLQAVTQFWLPHQVESSSQLYGQLGVLLAFLGWFFFLGRALAFSFALNAVIYEQLGSVSALLFSLPVVRLIPQRIPAVGRYFALDHVAGYESEAPRPEEPSPDRP